MRIALDDFGAGFCNFRYLKLLPLDYLKLDRSMVDGIASDPRDLAVLRAIVAMAGALDLQVIAEGIESEAQRSRISEEGCAFYQGFLKAAPMTAEAFGKMAADSS
jgi:EAL domain-containing protein (putative c-di-GMP-specific phosphodiesterase class I)